LGLIFRVFPSELLSASHFSSKQLSLITSYPPSKEERALFRISPIVYTTFTFLTDCLAWHPLISRQCVALISYLWACKHRQQF